MTTDEPVPTEAQSDEGPLKSKKQTGPNGDERPDRVYVGTGFYWPVAVALVLAAALIALVLQNTHVVEFNWLMFTFEAPLVVVILVTALIAGTIDEIVGWAWRRRRRRVLAERAELKKLKGQQAK